MKLHDIREQRALRVTEMRAILSAAESAKRSLTADEQTKFDKLKGEVAGIEADEARAQFLEDAERRMLGTGDAQHRDHANLESRVSLLDVLQAGLEGRALTGAAAEYSREAERRTGRKAQGAFIPLALLEQRVAIAGNSTAGGYLVGTDNRADQFIQPFRNKLLMRKLGARVLSGLRGDVAIPRHTGSTTAGWVGENQSLTPSDMTFGSVSMTPRHVGALSEMSRQLIQQSSPDIEQLLRDDMSFALAQAIDSAMIAGDGITEPLGILNATGFQTGNLATLSWATVAALLEKLELVNADASAWLTQPDVATKLRTTLKETGLPGYLLDGGKMADLPVHVTNQVPTNTTPTPDTGRLILGDFAQMMLGIWSELDILVNPYDSTAYARGGVLVRAMATCDTAIRHREAFVVVDDIAL